MRGANYDEKCSPQASMTMIRVLAQKVAQNGIFDYLSDRSKNSLFTCTNQVRDLH